MRSIHSYLVNGICRSVIRGALSTGIDLVPHRQKIIQLSRRAPVDMAGLRILDRELDGLAARWFIPDHSFGDKAVLYFHGGAFVLPWFGLHEGFCAHLARQLGATVIMPDYRLAPEHVFPAAPDDCLHAYQWLLKEGYQASDIAVAGDSAGGNLSLVTLMTVRDRGLPLPSCAVMLSPVTNFCFSGRSVRENDGKDPMFIASATERMVQLYVPVGQSLEDYRLSPLRHNYRGLPPLRFYAGSTELLRDDSSMAAARARTDGVDARAHIAPFMPHVYPLVPYLPEAKRATREIVEFIAAKLAGNSALPLARMA